MANWSTELFSDTDGQCNGQLKDNHGKHCCLGILEERTLHMNFMYNDMYDEITDNFGKSGYIDMNVASRVELDKLLTNYEADKLNKLAKTKDADTDLKFSTRSTRYIALAALNDDSSGFTFPVIATIVVLFDWDVADNPNFMDQFKEEMNNG